VRDTVPDEVLQVGLGEEDILVTDVHGVAILGILRHRCRTWVPCWVEAAQQQQRAREPRRTHWVAFLCPRRGDFSRFRNARSSGFAKGERTSFAVFHTSMYAC
jgi:hypothetical protein